MTQWFSLPIPPASVPTIPDPTHEPLRCRACNAPVEVQGLNVHLAFNGRCVTYLRILYEKRRRIRFAEQRWGYWLRTPAALP